MDRARRSFLRGRPGAGGEPLRPPWALAEKIFTDRCTRCGDCVSVCPTGLLQSDGDGFPVAVFAGASCDFCGRCAAACRPQALLQSAGAPWNVAARIGDACLVRQDVVCRSCGESCDAGAITFRLRPGGMARPELDSLRCTGCGDCVPSCPVDAIVMQHRQPQVEEAA